MENDDVRLLEHKSRILEHELQVRRIELGRIECEVHSARDRVATSSAAFRQVKEMLLRSGVQKPAASPAENLAAAKALAAKLSKLNTTMVSQEREVKSLSGREQSIRQVVARCERQTEKLAEHLQSLHKNAAAALDRKEDEEVEDLAVAQKAGDPKRGFCGRDEAGSSDTGERAHADSYRGVNREHCAGDLLVHDRMNQDTAAPFGQQALQQSHSDQESPRQQRLRTFREALSDSMRQRVESLEKWEKLDQRGVGFQVSTTAGKKIGVEIAAHTSGGITVRLEPENERDRRLLWLERKEIVAALTERGCRVKTVFVRAKEKPCR